MRKTVFANDEYYHIYNRGVEKRDIFMDDDDFARFLLSMQEFNVTTPIGSIYQNSFKNKQDHQLRSRTPKPERLVEFIAYCLNPNHYHILLKQNSEKGIQKFVQKLGTGYTNYFNLKYKRSGALFQGKFKAKHIDTNEYLLHVSSYVDLNFKVHNIAQGRYRSSWNEDTVTQTLTVNKDIVLSQLRKKSDYQDFATQTVAAIKGNRHAASQGVKTLFME